MRAVKIIAYVAAAILILFGVLFILSAFGEGGRASSLLVGGILALIGMVLIFWAARRPAEVGDTNVTLQIDLPANVNLDTLKCQSCGGVLTSKDITMVQGAPMVTCPFCGTTYQITEEPKW